MTSMLSDAADQKYATALAEFDALTQARSDSETLIKNVVQITVRSLEVGSCHIYRREKESRDMVWAAGAGTDACVREDLRHVAARALERHENGLPQPLQTDGSLAVVIEGDSAPFGVCVAHRGSAQGFTCDDLQFVRSIAGLLSGAFRRAHSVRDKARLSALIATADDAIIEVTGDGRIFNWNAAAETLFGYSRHDIIGLSVLTLVDKADASDVVAMLAAVCRGTTLCPRETTCRRVDGSAIDVVVRAAPIVLPDGRITAATLNVRDVREKRAADRQLQVQTDILAQMPAAVMVWRLDDHDDAASLRLVLANREANAASGSPLDARIGARFADVAFSPVVVPDAEVYASVVRTGVPRDLGEHPGLHRQDTRPWYHVQALPLPDSCVGVVFQDVTERRALTDQLHHAQRMEVVGRLAGGVAHDFNNILTVVNGYSELLRLKIADPLALKDLAEIERAAELARQLTRQLLAFGRRQTLRLAPVDLTALAKSARGMLDRVLGEDVQLCVVGEEPVTVLADAGQIDQVLLNLAVNARDAMPAGGKLFVESYMAEVAHDVDDRQSLTDPSAHIPPGSYGVLTVSDTGLGMDPSTVARIFEPFFTTKEAGKGTGLGLSTVHGIVKQCGGHIAVRSEPGQGTTFKIYLPIVNRRPVALKPEPAKSKRLASVNVASSSTVLLVEDDDAVRYLLRRVLTTAGLNVLEASGPAEALDAIGRFSGNVDLLLSDVVMSGHSGPELGSQLKFRFPEIQLVYMSGYAPDGVGHRKLPADARFLAKPFSRQELMGVVQEALRVT